MDFSNLNLKEFGERIKKFRTLCMLDYGSFRFGYRRFRQGILIKERWKYYFPSPDEVEVRAEELRKRPEPVGLIPISGGQLFSLGYLAGEHAPRINQARGELKEVLDAGLRDGTRDFASLEKLAQHSKVRPLTTLLAESGIPGTEALDLPLFGGGNREYADILRSLYDGCIALDKAAIERVQGEGLQNARTYMAMHDLDVYVATSMREPLHFTTNWAFVQRLFHQGPLKEWSLRYFDPTQAYLSDRIQKGLLECLMIKRARLTVYNAQEADTFGKDSEAGVTLAQGKPVIVYVARLFEHVADLHRLYQAIDENARVERDAFIESLLSREVLTQADREQLLAPEKTKADVMTAAVGKTASMVLGKLGDSTVAMELIRQGYDPGAAKKEEKTLVVFAIDRILRLERRALQFRDTHPLALQTSPLDGVSRGVIVTRTVEHTAEVISGIFLGTLEYDIADDLDNWLLVDRVTRSPVRVVTKDAVLTTAFWSEKWGKPDG